MHDFRHNEQYGLDPGFSVCLFLLNFLNNCYPPIIKNQTENK